MNTFVAEAFASGNPLTLGQMNDLLDKRFDSGFSDHLRSECYDSTLQNPYMMNLLLNLQWIERSSDNFYISVALFGYDICLHQYLGQTSYKVMAKLSSEGWKGFHWEGPWSNSRKRYALQYWFDSYVTLNGEIKQSPLVCEGGVSEMSEDDVLTYLRSIEGIDLPLVLSKGYKSPLVQSYVLDEWGIDAELESESFRSLCRWFYPCQPEGDTLFESKTHKDSMNLLRSLPDIKNFRWAPSYSYTVFYDQGPYRCAIDAFRDSSSYYFRIPGLERKSKRDAEIPWGDAGAHLEHQISSVRWCIYGQYLNSNKELERIIRLLYPDPRIEIIVMEGT
jgi:hypothetical protein